MPVVMENLETFVSFRQACVGKPPIRGRSRNRTKPTEPSLFDTFSAMANRQYAFLLTYHSPYVPTRWFLLTQALKYPSHITGEKIRSIVFGPKPAPRTIDLAYQCGGLMQRAASTFPFRNSPGYQFAVGYSPHCSFAAVLFYKEGSSDEGVALFEIIKEWLTGLGVPDWSDDEAPYTPLRIHESIHGMLGDEDHVCWYHSVKA